LKLDWFSVIVGILGAGTLAYIKTQTQDLVKELATRAFAYLRAKLHLSPGTTAAVAFVALAALGVPPNASCQTTHNAVLSYQASSTSGVTYNIYRSNAPGALSTKTKIKTGVAGLTYTDTPLQAKTQYCYQVTATDGVDESLPSNEVCGTTAKDPIGVPGSLTVTIN